MSLKHQHLMKQFINIFKLLIDKKKINQQLKKLHGRNLKILNKIKWVEFKNYKMNKMNI